MTSSWLRRLDVGAGAERAVLAAVLAIAALISYTHLRDVWLAAGSPWPDLGPLLVDGLFAAAWLRMRRRRRQGDPVGWLAWAALGLALAATLAGNIAAAVVTGHTSWLSIVVAAWPACAFALVWELVTGHGRRPASPAPADRTDLAEVMEQEETLEQEEAEAERIWRLIEVEKLGRDQLARELRISSWAARGLIEQHRQRVEASA